MFVPLAALQWVQWVSLRWSNVTVTHMTTRFRTVSCMCIRNHEKNCDLHFSFNFGLQHIQNKEAFILEIFRGHLMILIAVLRAVLTFASWPCRHLTCSQSRLLPQYLSKHLRLLKRETLHGRDKISILFFLN